jgi:hypothetical protein
MDTCKKPAHDTANDRKQMVANLTSCPLVMDSTESGPDPAPTTDNIAVKAY